jgi:hypothetical protein
MKNNQTKSGRGGARLGAGRKAGSPNKATASLKDIAREYTTEALDALLKVMRSDSAPPAAVVAASNAILDRGYGKPSQVLAGDDEGGPIKVASRIELIGVPSVHSPA